jgi:cathepsin L
MPCRKDVPLAAAISGYVNVQAYEPDHLKEAILTKGPMTVSLDADDDGFRFYRAGIYYNPTCTNKPPEALDHAVMISGYGRDPETGREYWILKNMWSTFWGEGGYMRMDMRRNDCGVSALPEYVILDAPLTRELRANAS